jgi:hypothetical protein
LPCTIIIAMSSRSRLPVRVFLTYPAPGRLVFRFLWVRHGFGYAESDGSVN